MLLENYCFNTFGEGRLLGSFGLYFTIEGIVHRIKDKFSDVNVVSTYIKDIDEYSISIDSEEVYFSDSFLEFASRLVDELDAKNITNVSFTCDLDKKEKPINMIGDELVEQKDIDKWSFPGKLDCDYTDCEYALEVA